MSIAALKHVLQTKLNENKMNPTELEKQAGLSASSVRRILLGNSQNPTLETLIAISNVFGCSIDELIGKRIITKEQGDEIIISDDIVWDNALMKSIFMETFDFICKKNIAPTLKKTINFILETYNFCLLKKNGEFDKAFHEWYIQQKLQENHK